MQDKLRFAIRVIRERIRLDQDRVSKDVREVLEAIDVGLLDPNFKIGSLKLSKATRERFSEYFDATPHRYLQVRQVEISLYVLDYTNARVPEVAASVGYRKTHTFLHIFKKLMGRPPIQERRRWRKLQAEGKSSEGGSSLFAARPWSSRVILAPIDRRALVGALSPHSVAFHLATLRLLPGEHEGQVITSWMDEYLASQASNPEEIPDDPGTSFRPQILPAAEEEQLLADAARPTLELLKDFESGAAESFRPLLAELRRSIVMPGSTVEQIKEDLKASSFDLASFTRVVGLSPWQYILEGRMETASRLLRDSLLSVQAIAFLIGYADPPQFRRAFKKWSGDLSPIEYRSRIRAVVSRVGLPEESFIHWRYLDLARTEDTPSLVSYLEKVYSFAPSRARGPEEAESKGVTSHKPNVQRPNRN